MRDFKKTFFLFKKPAHAQPAEYFVKAEKPLYERTPLPDQRRSLSPPPFFHLQSAPPPLSIRQAVFAKLIQRFTVLKHLWVRYYNNSSNIIFM